MYWSQYEMAGSLQTTFANDYSRKKIWNSVQIPVIFLQLYVLLIEAKLCIHASVS